MINKFKEFNESKEEPVVEREFYKNGQKEYELWYLNGERHREDGPALQGWYADGQKNYEEWFLNDKQYSREEWIDKLKEIDSPHYEEQKMLYDAENYNI